MENTNINQQQNQVQENSSSVSQKVPQEKVNNLPAILLVGISAVSLISLSVVLIMRMANSNQPISQKNSLVTQTYTSSPTSIPTPTLNALSDNETQEVLSTDISDFDSEFTQIEKDLSSL